MRASSACGGCEIARDELPEALPRASLVCVQVFLSSAHAYLISGSGGASLPKRILENTRVGPSALVETAQPRAPAAEVPGGWSAALPFLHRGRAGPVE